MQGCPLFIPFPDTSTFEVVSMLGPTVSSTPKAVLVCYNGVFNDSPTVKNHGTSAISVGAYNRSHALGTTPLFSVLHFVLLADRENGNSSKDCARYRECRGNPGCEFLTRIDLAAGFTTRTPQIASRNAAEETQTHPFTTATWGVLTQFSKMGGKPQEGGGFVINGKLESKTFLQTKTIFRCVARSREAMLIKCLVNPNLGSTAEILLTLTGTTRPLVGPKPTGNAWCFSIWRLGTTRYSGTALARSLRSSTSSSTRTIQFTPARRSDHAPSALRTGSEQQPPFLSLQVAATGTLGH
eukprot:385833-Rhodomonas_salina.4